MTTASSDPTVAVVQSHDWYVLRGEHQSGPFEHDILVSAFAAGELFASDFVWREGFAEWLAAGEVFGEGTAGEAPDGAADDAADAADDVAPEVPEVSAVEAVEPIDGGDAITVIEAFATGETAGPTEPADKAESVAATTGEVVPDPATFAMEPPEAVFARPPRVIELPSEPEAALAQKPAIDPAEAPTVIHMPTLPPPIPAFVAAEELPPPLPPVMLPVVPHESELPTVGQPAAETPSPALGFVSGSLAPVAASGMQRSTYPADGAAPMWPMPIGPFLSGPYLQRADVVLTRKNRDLTSWLIRFATRGSFSHAAMVFLVPHQERGFNNSFVIESASDGVDLTNFRDLVEDRRMVIGIKRLVTPWFTDEVQSAVRGRLLNSIKSSYNYATILRLARAFLADITFGIKSRVYGPGRAIASAHARQIQPPNKFICSGLVQLGFVHTLLDMADQKRLPAEFLSDIVFRDDLAQFLPRDWNEFTPQEQHDIMWEFSTGFADLLEAVTPEDLAASPKLEWVYVIKRGLVYPVSSDNQVRDLMTWKPKKRKA